MPVSENQRRKKKHEDTITKLFANLMELPEARKSGNPVRTKRRFDVDTTLCATGNLLFPQKIVLSCNNFISANVKYTLTKNLFFFIILNGTDSERRVRRSDATYSPWCNTLPSNSQSLVDFVPKTIVHNMSVSNELLKIVRLSYNIMRLLMF